MARPAIDLAGQTFGRLRVVGRARVKANGAVWECSCACGGRIAVIRQHLTRRDTQSCGCLRRELSAKRIMGVCDESRHR